MNRRLLLVLLVGALVWWCATRPRPAVVPPPAPVKPPDSKPKPRKPRPCPGPGPCPLEDNGVTGSHAPVEGGRVSPDGAVEVVCDLPATERKKNIASKGLGCCVFRSIDYAARWQNVPPLFDLPEKMRDAGIPGGGYPEKATRILEQFAPGVPYIQDTSGDVDILEAILRTGRLPCVTYCGRDCHYGNQRIAHMVCLPYFDRATGWACVSDNNFPDDNSFVWMSTDELVKRWKGGGGGGWVICLLNSPPPPVPHN